MKVFENLTDREAFALARMKADPDFQHLLVFLERNLKAIDEQNRRMEGPGLYRCQGMALALDELLELARTSSEIVQRIRVSRASGT